MPSAFQESDVCWEGKTQGWAWRRGFVGQRDLGLWVVGKWDWWGIMKLASFRGAIFSGGGTFGRSAVAVWRSHFRINFRYLTGIAICEVIRNYDIWRARQVHL